MMQGLNRILLLLLLTGAAGAAEKDIINGFELSSLSVPREYVMHGGPPRDGIPALTDPKFIPAEAAKLQDKDRILGISRNGVSKAYPLAILNWHEIVNDRFGDEAVVVTYCPLCFTGMAFQATANGKRQTFGVSGLLYNSDVLLYDHQTESLWSQVMAEAISGPSKGQKLQPVPTDNTTWAAWHKAHPDTLVLSRDTGHARNYDHNSYAFYDQSIDVVFPVRFRAQGYHPKERVLGLTINGQHKAYPFKELHASKTPLHDKLGGQSIRISFDPDNDAAQAYGPNGKQLPGLTAYWFAWYAFHPDTAVYKAGGKETQDDADE